MIAVRTTARTSRPLRALALVLLCYGAGRTAIVWTSDETIALDAPPFMSVAGVRSNAIASKPKHRSNVVHALSPPPPEAGSTSPLEPVLLVRDGAAGATARTPASVGDSRIVRTLLDDVEPLSPSRQRVFVPARAPGGVQAQPATLQSATRDRWSGSFYAVTRGSGAVGAAPTLGGTQAGARVYRTIGHGLSATASLAASPRSGGAREATLGLAFRRGAAGAIVEHSFVDRGGSSSLRALGYAGVAQALPAQFRLEGYGQAGVTRAGGFAEGALSVGRPILAEGRSELSAGLATWGSVQRGARRVDVGPQLVARLPVADRSLRVSAEWRQRISGNAVPGSGPSVTLGLDF